MITASFRSVAIFLLTFACSLAAYVSGAFRFPARAPAKVMELWGRSCIRVGGWRVRAEGLDRLPGGGAILVSNHQSLLDIPLFLSVFRKEIKFLAKQELGAIPLFGKAMAYAGNLFVDREDPRGAVHLMREAVRRIRQGQVVVIFPEGTRSVDGSIGEFKPGAFILAQKAGVPVLPVYIEGGCRALPKGSLRIRPAELVVRVLEPLTVTAGLPFSKQKIAEDARRRILQARAEEEARGADPGL